MVVIVTIITNQYNTLIKLDENVKTQRGQVEAVYQRRSDLIPNIVATVKGEANFEQETLQKVIEARASATQLKVEANSADELIAFQNAQENLTQALGKLLMITENYPDLKANQGFSDLRVQLEGTENRISVERMNYNKEVQKYNISTRSFPISVVAKFFGFKTKTPFQSDSKAEQAPEIEF